MLRFFDRVAAIRRVYGSSSNVGGQWVTGAPVDTAIEIIRPQPITGREMMFVPEGERNRRYQKTWTDSQVQVKTDTNRADSIVYRGVVFEVFAVEDWEEGSFFKVIMREDIG